MVVNENECRFYSQTVFGYSSKKNVANWHKNNVVFMSIFMV